MNEEDLLLINNKFITIRADDAMMRVSVHIRGEFPDPASISEELAMLYALSSEYQSIVIFINSPGGRVDSLAEILNVFELYESVITVGTGVVGSAAFNLWASGDIRVVQKYASMMAHRESYAIHVKTDQQKDYAEHASAVYGKLHSDLLSCILTEDELEFSKRSEVFLSTEELISRGVAISWENFVERDLTQFDKSDMLYIDDRIFIPMRSDDGDSCLAEVTVDIVDVYPYNDVIYKHVHEEKENALEEKPEHYTQDELPDQFFVKK